MPLRHHAIDRDALAGAYHQAVAGHDFGHRHVDLTVAPHQVTSHASPACALLFFQTDFNLTNIKNSEIYDVCLREVKCIILLINTSDE